MSLITAGWIEALRARSANPRFAAARDAIAAQAGPYRRSLPPHPTRQAGYYHDFFCPEHAVQLRFDPEQPHHHVCPVDETVFSGEPFDSAWRWSVNDLLSDAALKLSVSAALGGGDTAGDAERALAIVRGYAERYRTMEPPIVPHPHHPGVVTWSGLDEAVWIIRLTWAYALPRAGSAGRDWAEDDAAIRDDLLRPAAEHMHHWRYPEIHNVRTWNNAALVTLAVALGDEALLDETLHGPLGVEAQLAEGLLPDGSWWEGSLSYHYYTLAALIWTVRALRASGRTFSGDDAVRRMFTAPLALALPDLTLPAINDCWYHIGLRGEVGHGIPDAAGFYEVAYGWYGDPAFAWVLRQNEGRDEREASGTRRSFEALLDGATTIMDAPEPATADQVAADSGTAVLRTQAPRDHRIQVLLKAAPDGGGHAHPDQLGIQLYGQGARLVTDLGTAGYGIGLNDTWYRQTASHATVLIDGVSQPNATARVTRYEPDGDQARAEGTVNWDEGAYAGVQMRRTIIVRDGYGLDLFRVRCPTPRQIDWLLPCLGALVDAPPSEPADEALTGPCGYEHFAGVRRLTGRGDAPVRWHAGSVRLHLYLPPEEDERFLATAPGNPAPDVLSVLVRRQVAETALFAAVFAVSRVDAPVDIKRVRWFTAGPSIVEIESATGTMHWDLD